MTNISQTQTIVHKFAKSTATLLLGIVIPFALMLQAYSVLHETSSAFQTRESLKEVTENFLKVKNELSNTNEFLLYSKLHTEHVNYEVMINKQIMKVAVMNIGFAVVSVGIMFILLGFKEPNANGTNSNNGISVAGEANGIKFDIKTGSTGLAIFVLGAVMATSGGVLPNEFHTADIPGYWGWYSKNVTQNQTNEKLAVQRYKDCRDGYKEEKFASCFTNIFYSIYKGEIEK